MEGFLDSHKIISKFHHGGRKGHSTTTALAMIQNFLYNNKEQDNITLTLLTDLSAAYDTIDHEILIKKSFTDQNS